MAQIIGLFSAGAEKRQKRDWSNQDIAELYRVESALIQAGLHVETERGTSDEGDPWFVFCHRDGGDVIVHFARIDGRYVIAAPVLARPLSGTDLNAIVRRFVSDNPVSIPSPNATLRGNVILHPAALLTIFVATILVLSEPAEGLAAGLSAEPHQPVSADADTDAAWSVSADMEPFGSSSDDASHSRVGEKTLLLIAVAMAIEVARLHDQGESDSSGVVFGFDEDQFANLIPLHRERAESAVVADLYGSTEPMSSAAFEAVNDEPPEHSETFGVADLGLPADKKPLPHDLHMNLTPAAPHESVAEVPYGDGGIETGPVADRQISLIRSDPPSAELPAQTQPPAGAAHAWFESNIATEGWSVTVLDRDHIVAVKVAELVEDSLGLLDPVDEAAPAAAPGVENAPLLPINIQMFDPSAQRVVDYFQASDSDIAVIERLGSIVIFDRSDFIAGDRLESHVWVFDDHTTLMILGHVDTVTEAMGLLSA
jgi:hypothetical protein